jgi:hypothetical protein
MMHKKEKRKIKKDWEIKKHESKKNIIGKGTKENKSKEIKRKKDKKI